MEVQHRWFHSNTLGYVMPNGKQDTPDDLQQRQRALSRWENEGGHLSPSLAAGLGEHVPQLTHAELVQLRIRVIALENLVIALLAEASDQQINLVREMAAIISPHPGSTHHPLTVHAADHMTDLLHRAGHFRRTAP